MSSQLPLHGKVALVTGSSRSIGAAMVQALAAQGANVVVNYVTSPAAAEDLAKEINSKGNGKAVTIKGDTSSVAGGTGLIDETVKAFGRIDILVLNAGLMDNKPPAAVDEADFDAHYNINTKTPFFMAKKAAEIMEPGGRIIFISSSLTIGASITPIYLSYLASKGAIEQVSRVLAKDYASKGLTVNTISPGPTDTPLFTAGKPAAVIEAIAKQNPFGRLGKPEDIGPVVAFVASPGAQWLNGQNIRVNGGAIL
ncbi:NAD-P-binding protein [Flagelloscypha sp. PMI_526]|nr:NAD-P-binding protein [Flagelloscypha sp. PMI_526]